MSPADIRHYGAGMSHAPLGRARQRGTRRTGRHVVGRVILGTAAAALLGATAAAVAADDALQRQAARHAAAADLAAVASIAEVTDDREDLRRALARTGSGRDGRLAVHLPAGTVGRSATVTAPTGPVLRRDVLGPHGPVTVEAVVAAPAGAGHLLRTGTAVALTGAVTAGLALALARRHAGRVEAELTDVVRVARALGDGDFTARAHAGGLTELDAVARGLNAVADRVAELREAENRMVADLSHRLRTPLTVLALDTGSLGSGPHADRIRTAVTALEHDIDALIRRATTDVRAAPGCDAAAVVASRMDFWAALGAHHHRRAELRVASGPAPIAVRADELAAVLDALLGNVFRHTPPGTAFAVDVVRHAGWVTIVVDDAGPGFADPTSALRRGVSSAGSTGLGVAIARDAVESTGGTLHLERSRLGGARVRLRFGEAGSPHADPHEPRAWRLWSGRGSRVRRPAGLPPPPDPPAPPR